MARLHGKDATERQIWNYIELIMSSPEDKMHQRIDERVVRAACAGKSLGKTRQWVNSVNLRDDIENLSYCIRQKLILCVTESPSITDLSDLPVIIIQRCCPITALNHSLYSSSLQLFVIVVVIVTKGIDDPTDSASPPIGSVCALGANCKIAVDQAATTAREAANDIIPALFVATLKLVALHGNSYSIRNVSW